MTQPPTGTLIGVGVGPGDPELLTIKAVKAIQTADVIAFHARPGGVSAAKTIATNYLSDNHELELLEYPVTTGIVDHPGGYAGAMADFYLEATTRLAAHLAAGKTVAVLTLGDPMLYSSYQHLHRVLAEQFPSTIIPGIPSITAAADALGQPLCEEEEILTVLPGTLDQVVLTARLRDTDCAVIMKLGRTFPKVKQALIDAGVADKAYVVVRASMTDETIIPVLAADPETIPYFAVVVVPSTGGIDATDAIPAGDKPRGEVVVVGLGPGSPQWITPEATMELAHATDIVGYSTYVNRVPHRAGQKRHPSDNKVEAERAAMALDLAKRGRRVAVVSSGDPGVFAMAAAVIETADDDQWRDVPVRIVPGMTAAQAVASRVGAPLGHDFGMISLSDRLKPFEVVENRVRALAGADMAFAVYNPASKERRDQVAILKKIVAEYQAPTTPVIVARAVGSNHEQVTVTTLADFDPSVVDMQTMLIIGASTTRTYQAGVGTDEGGGKRVFTSRRGLVLFRMKITRALIVATTTALIATGTTAAYAAPNTGSADQATSAEQSLSSKPEEGSAQGNGLSSENNNTDLHHTAGVPGVTKNSSGSAEVKKLKVGDGSSKSEAWFERQNPTIQTAVLILGVMGVIGLVIGPLRVAVYNFFHI